MKIEIVWYILGCLFAAIFGAATMAFFKIGKRTDVERGIEPSLKQEENRVVITNAEKLAQELDLMCDNTICNLIPYEHCVKYKDCDKCRADWLREEWKGVVQNANERDTFSREAD